MNSHFSAHELGEARRDSETESCAAVVPRGGCIGLRELLKNGVKLFFGNDNARVGDGKFHVDDVWSRSRIQAGSFGGGGAGIDDVWVVYRFYLQLNPASRGELDRIADEIREHLADA